MVFPAIPIYHTQWKHVIPLYMRLCVQRAARTNTNDRRQRWRRTRWRQRRRRRAKTQGGHWMSPKNLTKTRDKRYPKQIIYQADSLPGCLVQLSSCPTRPSLGEDAAHNKLPNQKGLPSSAKTKTQRIRTPTRTRKELFAWKQSLQLGIVAVYRCLWCVCVVRVYLILTIVFL